MMMLCFAVLLVGIKPLVHCLVILLLLGGAVSQWVERWTCDLLLAINRSRVQIPLGATLHNNLGQVVHTYVPLSPSDTSQRAVMLCGWESNCRPGGK